jgi:hypothetical protein
MFLSYYHIVIMKFKFFRFMVVIYHIPEYFLYILIQNFIMIENIQI